MQRRSARRRSPADEKNRDRIFMPALDDESAPSVSPSPANAGGADQAGVRLYNERLICRSRAALDRCRKSSRAQ